MSQALFIAESKSLPWRFNNRVEIHAGQWEALTDEPFDVETVRLFFADCCDDAHFLNRVRHVASGTTFDAASFARHYPV